MALTNKPTDFIDFSRCLMGTALILILSINGFCQRAAPSDTAKSKTEATKKPVVVKNADNKKKDSIRSRIISQLKNTPKEEMATVIKQVLEGKEVAKVAPQKKLPSKNTMADKSLVAKKGGISRHDSVSDVQIKKIRRKMEEERNVRLQKQKEEIRQQILMDIKRKDSLNHK